MLHQKARRRFKGRRGVQSDLGARQSRQVGFWAEHDQYVGKVLFVKAGQSLSLQFHRVKDESWYVYAGRAKLEFGSSSIARCNRWIAASCWPKNSS